MPNPKFFLTFSVGTRTFSQTRQFTNTQQAVIYLSQLQQGGATPESLIRLRPNSQPDVLFSRHLSHINKLDNLQLDDLQADA